MVCAILMMIIFRICFECFSAKLLHCLHIIAGEQFSFSIVLQHFQSILYSLVSVAEAIVQKAAKKFKSLINAIVLLFHCAICTIVLQDIFIHLHCFPCRLHFKRECQLQCGMCFGAKNNNEKNRHISLDFKDIIYILVVCNCTCFFLSLLFLQILK